MESMLGPLDVGNSRVSGKPKGHGSCASAVESLHRNLCPF